MRVTKRYVILVLLLASIMMLPWQNTVAMVQPADTVAQVMPVDTAGVLLPADSVAMPMPRSLGKRRRRVVGSSVAKSLFSESTSALVSVLSRVDLPALV